MKVILTEEQHKVILNEMAYPSSFDMEIFKRLPTFNKRKIYCDQRLKKISSGSSRIVYLVDDTRVLKMAKNVKGIEQNTLESDYFIRSHYNTVAAICFESDENNYFVEMELARKCSKSLFKKILGFDFDLVQPYLSRRFDYHRPQYYGEQLLQKFKELDENEWMYDLSDMVGAFDMNTGDFSKVSSYGIVKRNEKDAVVLIDYGLTNDAYREYYGGGKLFR